MECKPTLEFPDGQAATAAKRRVSTASSGVLRSTWTTAAAIDRALGSARSTAVRRSWTPWSVRTVSTVSAPASPSARCARFESATDQLTTAKLASASATPISTITRAPAGRRTIWRTAR